MRGETTRVEIRGETTRGETTRGETSWGCILIAGNVREDMVGLKGVVVVRALYLI